MRTEIDWTDTAWERYKDVQTEIAGIRAYYGDQLGAEHEAEFLRTFNRVTLAAGPVNIQRDGDGFLITTPHIVIGLVWTPDNDEQMHRRIRVSTGAELDEAYDDWPRTGRWSAHS